MSFYPHNGHVMLESQVLGYIVLISKLDWTLYLLALVKKGDARLPYLDVWRQHPHSMALCCTIYRKGWEIQKLYELTIAVPWHEWKSLLDHLVRGVSSRHSSLRGSSAYMAAIPLGGMSVFPGQHWMMTSNVIWYKTWPMGSGPLAAWIGCQKSYEMY